MQQEVSGRRGRRVVGQVVLATAGGKTRIPPTPLPLPLPLHLRPLPPLPPQRGLSWRLRRRHLTPSVPSVWIASTTWHTWTAACTASAFPASRSGRTIRQSVRSASSLLPPSCTQSALRTTSKSIHCVSHPPTAVLLPPSHWWRPWPRQQGTTTR